MNYFHYLLIPPKLGKKPNLFSGSVSYRFTKCWFQLVHKHKHEHNQVRTPDHKHKDIRKRRINGVLDTGLFPSKKAYGSRDDNGYQSSSFDELCHIV